MSPFTRLPRFSPNIPNSWSRRVSPRSVKPLLLLLPLPENQTFTTKPGPTSAAAAAAAPSTNTNMIDATQLVYQQDGQRLLHTAKIISVVPVSALPTADQALVKDQASDVDHAVVTDSTIFHVQGGGQPSDTGTMNSSPPSSSSSSLNPVADESNAHSMIFDVSSVRQPAKGGQILHFGRFRPPAPPDAAVTATTTTTTAATNHPSSFNAGDTLHQRVDADKRLLHSRLHTAGHIMSLAIHALCREGVLPPLKESKASHYPDSAAVVFNGTIDGKHKDAIQAKTDEFVRLARPVRIYWWPMDEVLDKCHGAGEGFALPEGETLARVVEMEGLGSYPCGGTHVQDCGQVGRIEVRKIARSKGTTKVSYRMA